MVKLNALVLGLLALTFLALAKAETSDANLVSTAVEDKAEAAWQVQAQAAAELKQETRAGFHAAEPLKQETRTLLSLRAGSRELSTCNCNTGPPYNTQYATCSCKGGCACTHCHYDEQKCVSDNGGPVTCKVTGGTCSCDTVKTECW